MTRTILIHLNISAPDDDERAPEEIAEAIRGAIEVGSDDEHLDDLTIVTALVEELEAR